MEKLVQLSDHEILIDFSPNTKCRTTIRLQSLLPSAPLAFKLQTSSPHKFLVNPPSGLVPPLSSASFQIEERARGGEGVECRDREGRTPLIVAAGKGNLRSVEALVRAGANVDARSRDGRTAVYRAAANGDLAVVEALVAAGADPTIGDVEHCRSAIGVARDKGHMEIVKVLEQGEAVLRAARRGELDTLEALLEKGANAAFCDQYGLTALHVAAIKGNKDVVMMLVEFGAGVEWQDAEGHTALHLAVEGGSVETVEVLICRGANVNATTAKGATPLHVSKLMEYEDITKLLLDKGAASVAPSEV